LAIDRSRAGARHLFHISGSLVELIVSEVVKEALADVKDLGIMYHNVT
jgi:hypothetical protein